MSQDTEDPIRPGWLHILVGGAALMMALAAWVHYLDQPPVSTRTFPPLPDFSNFKEVSDMKAAFIDYLTPIVDYQNKEILEDRKRLERITYDLMNGRYVLWFDKEWLKELANEYNVEWNPNNLGPAAQRLMSRVDIIPLPLVIVQAAKESSWGQSRFALEGNNLFGHWCFEKDCGIVPNERPDGANNKVRRFQSVSNAVRAYMFNLNTNRQYAKLRKIRQKLRGNHKPITGIALADGLLYYSERREDYINEVKQMIRQYHYFNSVRLSE